MKIKLAILDSDKNYLNRIVTVFGAKYAEELEIYSFTDDKMALNTLEQAKIDVFIASDRFEIDTKELPKRCGFAYFVDSADVETINEQCAICKFQKADLIYRQILSIYSENAGSMSGLKIDDSSTKVIVFTSPGGGAGSSSMAAACAVHFAARGKKTLYLNLEKFGFSDVFFHAEGQFSMSDIIFALKSKKANLAIKLESCVKQDQRGVYFYSSSGIALDMMELGTEEIIRLISELKLMGIYNYIIVDMDFDLNKDTLKVYHQAHAMVWVGDGSKSSGIKLLRAYTSLATIEENGDAPLTKRLSLIYNKFSNKTGKMVENIGAQVIGGVPRYEHATSEQVVNQLATMEMFEKII